MAQLGTDIPILRRLARLTQRAASAEQRILAVDRQARRLIFLATGGGLLVLALYVVWALLLSAAVSRVFIDRATLDTVSPLLGAMLGVLLARATIIGLDELLLQRAAGRVKAGLRAALTTHLFRLGPGFLQTQRSGELVGTATQGIELLDAYITQYLPARYLAALGPLLIFGVILLVDPWTTLVLLFAGPLLILMLALIGGQAREQTERRFKDMSWMSAHFLDMLQGLATLKLFGRSREQSATIEEISSRFGSTTMEILRTAFQTSLVLEWAGTAATALVALEVSMRLMNDTLSFERALALLLLTPEFFLPLRQFALKYHAGTEGKAAAERLFAILDRSVTPGATIYQNGNAPVQVAPHGDIRFERVTCRYDPARPPALADFSLTIRQGEQLALVGQTGAGKSSVANLLLRFVEPQGGQIWVGDVPLAQVSLAAWRAQVAWVGQHPHLFGGSVADNIRLGRSAATRSAVVAAAQAAYAHDFIEALPQGYDTPIGERGLRLSGGQRRRIALARAFLMDAPLLILDEATADLDLENERLIRAALRRLTAGRTVLIIAHRLQLAYEADRIVVLAEGRLAQSGTHAELLGQTGPYRALVASYAGGQP